MQRDSIKRFYLLHSWLGALTAVLMFVVAFTGAVSVFGRPELKIWAHEELHKPVSLSPASVEKVLLSDTAKVPDAYLQDVQILMPGVRRTPYLSLVFTREIEDELGKTDRHAIRFDHDPHTLAEVSRRQDEPQSLFLKDRKDVADFIVTFHADLHLGDPVGLMITGLLGLTLFASVVTGVITHRKILKEMFAFRPARSIRLLFTDSHKALGVWGMLFHAVIAFTGAFLGLAVVVLLPAAAFVSFEGDLERMVETYLPADAPQMSGEAREFAIADVLEKAARENYGPVVSVQILRGRDTNAVALVNTLAGKALVGETQRYRLADGERLQSYTQFSRLGGVAGPLLDTMFPLHFGNFGGVLIKFLWFFLGLSTAFLALSGAMIWIERRAHGATGKLSQRAYRRISQLTLGVCMGVCTATVSLLYVQRLFLPAVADTQPWLISTFFGVWLLVVAWTLCDSNVYRAAKRLLTITGLLTAFLPIVSAATLRNSLADAYFGGAWQVLSTELTCVLIGSALMFVGRRLPDSRPQRRLGTSAVTTGPIVQDAVAT
ncbi:MAG: PepSY-associated TM helix domain-containing protein [Congregibacter sp.]